jgi:acetate---CoA ligase (ADP-forming)
LQLASLPRGRLPAGNRVLISSFGGGSGVIATDQCAREGMVVPPLDAATRAALAPVLTPLASSMNPVDLTPGSMTNPANRANLPKVLDILADAPGTDQFLFFSSGFGTLAPQLADMFETLRKRSEKPLGISWLAPPLGTMERLAANGVMVFTEHARLIRTAGHLVRYAADLRHSIGVVPAARPFSWATFIPSAEATQVITEDRVARILRQAGLPVAHGGVATTEDEAVQIADQVGYKVAMKAISAAITHRAAAGLVALDLGNTEAVARTFRDFAERAAGLKAQLDGVWVQHMFPGQIELLVSAFRDQEFGVIVGCGMGGGMTEIIDDVVFTRAPINADGAEDLLVRLRTLRRLPTLLSSAQRQQSADFIARFSALAAAAPWQRFTLEVNPLKVGEQQVAAVDGLLVIG